MKNIYPLPYTLLRSIAQSARRSTSLNRSSSTILRPLSPATTTTSPSSVVTSHQMEMENKEWHQKTD
ncbi:hypothetical protein QVD17_07218 [Tagetes erecta]|uniref:Uncharacterized protein n=1 Tax=Tagetes erecta TaxID=13708 RepID=A0AAD8LKZ5_TARER|nr:hypothetical protein QVD17_07218 [Tagetes erecta]